MVISAVDDNRFTMYPSLAAGETSCTESIPSSSSSPLASLIATVSGAVNVPSPSESANVGLVAVLVVPEVPPVGLRKSPTISLGM